MAGGGSDSDDSILSEAARFLVVEPPADDGIVPHFFIDVSVAAPALAKSSITCERASGGVAVAVVLEDKEEEDIVEILRASRALLMFETVDMVSTTGGSGGFGTSCM